MNTTTNVAAPQSGHTTIFGIIAIILGMCAMMSPGVAGSFVVRLVGITVLMGGIIRILGAFFSGSLGKGVLGFVMGVLTLMCGSALIAHPLFTAGVLTVILAVYFIADGIAEISAAFKVRPVPGWGLLLFGGIVSLMLGIMIWRQYPLSGIWATGVLLGIKLFFVGMVMVAARRA